MILGQPWGLLALLALPTILAIHWFRRRYRPRAVTGLFLYGLVAPIPAAGRRRDRIVNRASLWLELLAALAAAWWLCDPHLEDREHGRHLVLVLDQRRSLLASVDGSTAAQRALDAALASIAGLQRGDRLTIIGSGRPPRLLVGPAARPEVGATALASWHPDAPVHDLDEAIALGLSLGGEGAQVLVITDREPRRLPPGVGLMTIGRPAANAGLADARWIRDSAGERIAIRVLAQGGEAVRSRRLSLQQVDGREIETRSLELTPGRPEAVTLAVPAGVAEDAVLSLRLVGEDPCPFDDQVDLRRPANRRVSVRIDLPAGPAATAVERAMAANPEVQVVEAGRTAHLVVTSEAGSADAGSWRIRIASGDADPVVGPFLVRRGDPVCTNFDATGALWSGGSTTADGEALVVAGSAVLLAQRRHGRSRELDLWCEPARSTVTSHPVWPVLWADLVRARRTDLPGPDDPNLPTGRAMRLVLPSDANRLAVIDAAGERAEYVADTDGAVLLPGFTQAGEYQLVAITEAGDRDWTRLRIHALDARLADLSSCLMRSQEPVAVGIDASVERARGPLAHLLPLMLLAAAALGAWVAFPREEAATGA